VLTGSPAALATCRTVRSARWRTNVSSRPNSCGVSIRSGSASRPGSASGPALAGLIAAAWGLKTCYAVGTVSFVASLHATARLPALLPSGPAGSRQRARPGLPATAEGPRFIGRRPRLPGYRRADRAAVPRLRPLPGHRGI